MERGQKCCVKALSLCQPNLGPICLALDCVCPQKFQVVVAFAVMSLDRWGFFALDITILQGGMAVVWSASREI